GLPSGPSPALAAVEETSHDGTPASGAAGSMPSAPGIGEPVKSVPESRTSASAHRPEISYAVLPSANREIELSPVMEFFSTPYSPSSEILSAATSEPSSPTPRSAGSGLPSESVPNR